MAESKLLKEFYEQRNARIESFKNDKTLNSLSYAWSEIAFTRGFTYNFEWMGRPIIQYPTDLIGLQEVIWSTKPDLIIETGVAHGGSLVMYAGLMKMMDIQNAQVIGVEIDLRDHNRDLINEHPMAKYIKIIDGSSVSNETFLQIKNIATSHQRVMVILDSLHTHAHVLSELNLYSGIVTPGNYLVVQDTHVEELPDILWKDRPWRQGDNPMTAVFEFLKTNPNYKIDRNLETKLQITCARNGWLVREY